MGSSDVAERLCRRALAYFRISKHAYGEGAYDVAATNCEIAAQLLLKSTYLFLGFSYPETRNIKNCFQGSQTLLQNSETKSPDW